MKVRAMVLCALFAALLAVCAWISVPVAEVAFTMQTFGVFVTLGLLGGKRGTGAIAVYLALGAVGLPVFTGFRGGAGVLLGATGGYLFGFLLSGLVYWLLTAWGTKPLPAMILGMLACYAVGTGWFAWGYLQQSTTVWSVVLTCVVPYLLPDGIKLVLAWLLTQRLKPYIS